ncbi:poly(hydroxyalkanoate) granule-associated protein [Acidovorax sp. 56]|uniref:phasin family protein n=1 Tax=Acidovorax sp. 56 TaxID=2035205 RepID=UPI000C162C54|nr:phasin family protein [Acidovorax sp. 56]PIF28761.1 poly(hydroxyalkanoate) granule-associated protein [Acidovorax sp. 56]
MASKKSFPFGTDGNPLGGVPLSDAVKESAQQIWLAGLGAFSKAQAEGGKVFEALVKEGTTLQRKTQTVAEEKITEATQRMASAANEMGSRAAGQWDKLETIFEDRVAKALGRLGIPTARDLQALHERIDALTAELAQARKTSAPRTAKAPAKTAGRAAGKATSTTAGKTAGKAAHPTPTKKATPRARKPAAK